MKGSEAFLEYVHPGSMGFCPEFVEKFTPK